MKRISSLAIQGSVFLALLAAFLALPVCGLAQSASPGSLGFPASVVGTAQTATQTTTFTNTSGVSLTSMSVSVTTNSSAYSVSTTPSTNCGGTLTAGSTCTITVTFTPEAIGGNAGVLTISWLGNGYSPFLVYLQGFGTAFGRLAYSTVPVGSVGYSSFGNATTDGGTGTEYIADLWIDAQKVSTGCAVLNAGTVTTDKGQCALYNQAGVLVANSAAAGAAHSGANAFQTYAWSPGTVTLQPGQYFVMYLVNGSADNFRSVAASTFINVVTATASGTFGTFPATITPPSTFTSNEGPVAYVY